MMGDSTSSSSSIDDDILLMLAYRYRQRMKVKRRWWVHRINQKRAQYGEYHRFVMELELDGDRFMAYFRVSREQFQQLLEHVGPEIAKQNTNFRSSISAKERLAICLRYLATGDSFRTIAYRYRCGISTVGKIIPEVCKKIWNTLIEMYMPMPSEQKWKDIAEHFQTEWNFPHCIGAIDGKHVKIQAPQNSGSTFFNYKGTFSVILLTLVDAHYNFIYIDVGSYGRNSDGGVFAYSSLGQALENDRLQIPPNEILPDKPELGRLPYVMVGDAAFPLKENMMKPFPDQNISEEKLANNYRLSRAQLVVENAFGHLARRWQLYNRTMQINPDSVIHVVKATCILHNFLRHNITVNGDLEDGELPTVHALEELDNVRGRVTTEAINVRQAFTQYFSSTEGRAPWQDSIVRRGAFNE